MNRQQLHRWALTGALLLATPAMATSPLAANETLIDPGVLANSTGAIGLNMAAGDSNAQLNAGALAVTVGQGVAAPLVNGHQHVQLGEIAASTLQRSTIANGALANTAGLVSVNQVSGESNAQANGFAIGLGFEGQVLAEAELAAEVTGNLTWQETAEGNAERSLEARIENGAFRAAKGLVQINQLAGAGNRTANKFALEVSPGASNGQ
ncbi:MAG: hypothetical protein OIF57_17765 [Marinobacterium sp.]|nr:hypothetical protein [Marinobacterium sp.]